MRAQELCVPGMERVERSEEEGRWRARMLEGSFQKR